MTLGSTVIVATCLLVGLLGSVGFAQPNKVEYELRERCGKRAAEVFKAEYSPPVANTDEGQILFNYRSHYNAALNKCFFLEISQTIAYRAKPQYSATMYRLYDINDNKEYGSFYRRSDANSLGECNVIDKSCSSEAEWELLIKRFMEDDQ
jgi:hypothetical protein